MQGQGAELAVLVSCLRALYQLHQSHHWVTKGATYYADHLLYQRMYEAILPEIDSVAERSAGSGAQAALDSVKQAQQTVRFLEIFLEGGKKQHASGYALVGAAYDPYQLAARSLEAELFTIGLVDQIASSGVSAGTRNLLEGIMDTHEGHVYLLNQRLSQV